VVDLSLNKIYIKEREDTATQSTLHESILIAEKDEVSKAP
jgi:hypothetical protein